MRKLIIGIIIVTMLLTIPTLTMAKIPDGWSLQVITPKPNDIITTSYLNIQVTAKGFRLDTRYAGTSNLPRVGHYNKLIDGQLIDMSDKQNDKISMVGITQGPHILTLVPAQNDHTELLERAVNIPFIYAGPNLQQPGPFLFNDTPSLMITSPINGSTVRGESFHMTVDISNFVLSKKSMGKEMVEGVGHWLIYVDLPPMMMNCSCDHTNPEHMQHMMEMMTHLKAMAGTNSQKISLKGLEPNMYHTFTAILVDNQHMHIMPMVMDMVTVYFAP